MADALDSGSSGSNPVRVKVPFSASIIFIKKPKTSLFSVFFFSTILKKTLCLRELFVISLETFD